MAELEYKTLISVDTGESINNVAELKENIKFLKKSLEGVNIESEEYGKTLDELQVNQNALKELMNTSASSFEELEKSANGVGESYNALVNRMKRLRQEQRASTDINRVAQLNVEITEINTRLKTMDANIGNYQRNVGDYSNSIEKAFAGMGGKVEGFTNMVGESFQSMGVGIGGVTKPIGAVNLALKALMANPIIAVIGALVLVIKKVIDALKTSEENMDAVRIALAPLNASTTIFTRVMQKLGEGIAATVTWLGKMLDKLGLVSEQMKIEQGIVKEEIALRNIQRETERKNADTTLEIAKLRTKVAEKDKYTAQERIKFIEEASKKEREIADRNVELARREYELLELKAAQAGNSTEENDALAEGYVRLQYAETDYYNKTRELAAQKVEALNQLKAEQAALNKTISEGIAEEVEEPVIRPSIELPEINGGVSFGELNDNTDYIAASKERMEWIDAEMKKKIEANEYLIEDERLKADANYQINLEAQEKKLSILENARMLANPMQVVELDKQIADAEVEIERTKAERIRTINEQLKQDRIAGLKGIVSSTSNILGTLANSMDVNNERQFKQQQALQVAQATVNTIAGAVGAFMGITSSTGGWGIAAAVAQAAAVTAAGMAQIAKIRQQKYTPKGGAQSSISTPIAMSSGASVEAPVLEPQFRETRNITSASEEDRLNRMAQAQRVYVVESDIQNALNKTRARVQEATFG